MKKPILTCVFCKHWRFDPGDRGYSEMTPGYSMSFACTKSHWELTWFTTEDEFRDYMLSAQTCEDYEPVEERFSKHVLQSSGNENSDEAAP